jgi:starch phosphorylase
VIHLYNKIKDNPEANAIPRTIIFGGKSAPSYFMAKLVIKLINSVADVIKNDEEVNHLLNVIFVKNYGVTLAEKIIPASDLSEQISTAGFEASGTGNMKFALNGALTIGTLDGANVEISHEVGDENIFIFGLTATEIMQKRTEGYTPSSFYDSDPALRRIVDMLRSNVFNKSEPGIFDPIVNELLNRDYYFVMADFESYIKAQEKVEETYKNKNLWTAKSIINVARMEKFSSDRAIREYARDIWEV